MTTLVAVIGLLPIQGSQALLELAELVAQLGGDTPGVQLGKLTCALLSAW